MSSFAILLCLTIFALTVSADGPFCTQSGVGPKDMMMTNGQMNPKYMWEKAGGSVRIPVVLDHAYSHPEKEVIFAGLGEMASKTCIKFFVYKHPEEVPGGDYVYITKSKGKGCWSYVGKQGGHQDLSLPMGCINHRTVMHEMMHALGFSHEHVRADRDKYVHILWDNIQRGRERNFERKQDSKSDSFGPYDYNSIMHYDNRAFSKNGHDTIRPLQHGFVQIGRNKRMSQWDATKINRAYKCHHSGKAGISYGPSGFNFGHTSNSVLDSPPVRFSSGGPPKSFRAPNPFLSGPPIRHHPNEIESDDEQYPDYSPFSPPPPYYMDRGEEEEDYYHP